MLEENSRKYREKYRVQRLVARAIIRAKKSGMACDVKFMKWIGTQKPEHCPCCAVRLNYEIKKNVMGPRSDGPSLDRVDTLKGYVRGNVDIICWRCNAIKRDATLHELEYIIAYMRRHLCTQ